MPESFVRQEVLGLQLLQPGEAAELPDDGPVEWAPLVPYSFVLWRSGVALAHEIEEADVAGLRVVELGCGLGVPSLVAARGGARVLATDEDDEALELLARNARDNGLDIETARLDWADAADRHDPFDLVLAADVLYERASVALLLDLLPRLGSEVWLADPGRSVASAFLEQAPRLWPAVERSERDGIEIYRLRGSA